ncbi:MAG TPA: DUF4276 family protein [Terriglobia bacterium]|nr:DUF4276 family protein [Terriglobia bacterium]
MRLHFVVEGQTEETFVRDVLRSELASQGIFCDARRIKTGRKGGKDHRGGLVSFQHLRNDLELWMKQDSGADSWFTTMVDLYRLPSDFPGITESRAHTDPIEKGELLEARFSGNLNHPRFVPYIQLHEFEALLFSDPQSFSIAFPSVSTAQLAELQAIRSAFNTPEHIDEGNDTSPSKRICGLLPQYVEPLSGPLIAKQIGLAKMRAECHHFNGWLERLEAAELHL